MRVEFSTIIISRPQEPLLRRAVLSALVQQEVDHEVVVVLDGPCAANRCALAPLASAQWRGRTALRVVEHERPLGRGAARATGVDVARGEWVATVDADDWLLPDKLQKQRAFLDAHPALVLASMGIYIVGRDGTLSGTRSHADAGVGTAYRGFPNFPSPAMAVRASLAKDIGYDVQRRAGEDRDFLFRALDGRPWAVQPDIAYAYEEYHAHSLGRCLRSYGRRSALAWRERSPLAAGQETLLNGAKSMVATAAFAFGQGDVLVARRSDAPIEADRLRFDQAKKQLMRQLHEVSEGASDAEGQRGVAR